MNRGLCTQVPCLPSPSTSRVLDVFFLSACVARCLPPLLAVRSHSASGRPVAMGGGNGAKSKTKRERNATKTAKAGKTSQLGANLKAMSIICTVCKQVRIFLCFLACCALGCVVQDLWGRRCVSFGTLCAYMCLCAESGDYAFWQFL